MSLNAAALRIMADKGLSLDDVIDIAQALEVRKDPTATERKRRQRERDKSQRDVTRDTGSPYEDTSIPSTPDYPDDANASPPPRQPVSEAFGIWKEAAAAVGWPIPRTLSPARTKTTGNRLREHGLDGWRACIARARASPYLGGTDPPTWFTFDWLVKSGNFLKVIEGNYDRRHTDNSDPTAVALQRLHAFS